MVQKSSFPNRSLGTTGTGTTSWQ